MDQHQDLPIRGSIPRLSKLPMPRVMASTDNLKLSARSSTAPNIHNDDLRKTSQLPRPAGLTSPLGETFNHSFRSRYGWTDMPTKSRSQSPVRDALRDVQASAMETTRPGSDLKVPVFEAGNENPTVLKAGSKDLYRPREPSPTPSSSSTRPDSPSKRPFRPPGRMSPTRELGPLPSAVSPGEIYTPPKAFVKGKSSRIVKPQEPRRTASSVFDFQPKNQSGPPTSRNSAQTMKLKPTYGSKTARSHGLSSKPSLSSIFREPQTPAGPTGKLAVSSLDSPEGLLKPRTRGENTLASSTPPKANSKAKRNAAALKNISAVKADEPEASNSPKSSAALRDSIAKARAANKKARQSIGRTTDSSEISSRPSEYVDEELLMAGNGKGLLRKRIQQATTSGYLNIAAMHLKQIPSEVMTMYESDNSTINWAEMVDLTKLNVADNELEELDEEVFPTEIDEEKNHQFLGLEVIDLHRNYLQRLPKGLSMLERLSTLNLNGNKLTNEAFDVLGRIPNLKQLFLSDNLIDGMLDLGRYGSDMSNVFQNLENLDLQGNKLDSFGGQGLLKIKSLKLLNLAGNKFSSLDWSLISTKNLTELNISKNRFSGILFPAGDKDFDELRTLDASYNQLEGLNLSSGDSETAFANLQSLRLIGNKMTCFPSVGGLLSLVALEIADNKIKDIPSDLARLKNLKSADFANNDIRFIPAEIASLSNLASLNLVGNPLREKKYLKMGTSELKMDLEKKLEPKQIHNDQSDASQPDTFATRYRYSPMNGILDLSSQALSTIPLPEIDLTHPIHTLKLSNNDLSSLPVALLSHPSIKYTLTSLDLSHNPFLHPTEHLTSEIFLPNLKSLYIVSTGLTSLDGLTTYLRAPELKEINISCHRLAGHVPWVRAWWPKVTTLLATDNWFTSVDVEGVRGLEVLDIRNNEIESLPPKLGLLGNLPDVKEKVPGRLRSLEVSGNRFRVPRLSVVEKGTEAVLKDLRRMIKTEEVTGEWEGVL